LGVCNSSFATTVKRDVDNPATPRPVWRHTPLPTVAWSVPLGCTRLGPRQGVCTGVAAPSRRLPRQRAHPHVRGVRARTGETPLSAVIRFALCRPNDYGSNPVRPMRTHHTSTTYERRATSFSQRPRADPALSPAQWRFTGGGTQMSLLAMGTHIGI